MIKSECPSCGRRVSVLTKLCPHCGASNDAHRTGIAVAGTLTMLLLATALAAIVAARGHARAAAAEARSPSVQHDLAAVADDPDQLTSAMTDCEASAAHDTDTLQFLVVPLASDAKDVSLWQEKSTNQIGNGVLLESGDALDALKSKALRVYRGEYDFRIRDEAANRVLRWRPTRGVSSFSTTDSGAIGLFHVQFATPRNRANDQWGSEFVRQSGTCYWVTAILGH